MDKLGELIKLNTGFHPQIWKTLMEYFILYFYDEKLRIPEPVDEAWIRLLFKPKLAHQIYSILGYVVDRTELAQILTNDPNKLYFDIFNRECDWIIYYARRIKLVSKFKEMIIQIEYDTTFNDIKNVIINNKLALNTDFKLYVKSNEITDIDQIKNSDIIVIYNHGL
jgi:hypothetical protein